MSSVTTPHSESPIGTSGDSPRVVPSLGELRQMTSQPDQRVVIRGVDWAFYEQLVDSTPDRAGIQVDYDGKDVEIMSPAWCMTTTRACWVDWSKSWPRNSRS